MKNIRFFLISILLSLPSVSALAGDLTSTYICDDCSYSDAVEMAKTKHVAPNCTADGMGDNGSVLLGATTFSCPTTSQTLIIADPINRTGFKFEVQAVQIVNWGTAYDITVIDRSMILEERDALEMFYEIDNDFRQVMEQHISIDSESFSSVDLQSASSSNTGGYLAMSSSDSSALDCSNHVSQILGSPEFRNNVENQLTQGITSRMGLQSWQDFTSSINNSVTLSLGTSLGISVNMESRQNEYFVRREDSNGGKLVYKVSYNGEKRTIIKKARMRTSTERYLDLSFKLMPGSSTIDGYRITSLFAGYSDLTEIPISVCLSEMLTKILNTNGATVTEGASSGVLINAVGVDASNGGTLIPRAGSWTNLSGCKIVEGTGRICRAGNDDCIQVRADYIDC